MNHPIANVENKQIENFPIKQFLQTSIKLRVKIVKKFKLQTKQSNLHKNNALMMQSIIF